MAGILNGSTDAVRQSNQIHLKPGESSGLSKWNATREGKPDASNSSISTVSPFNRYSRHEQPVKIPIKCVPGRCKMAPVVVARGARTLNDNFTAEAGLSPSQWTTQSEVLRELAALNLSDHRGTAPMPPILNFSEEGMEMSGVVGKNQFAAIASTETFSPPFTLTATVQGVTAHGNAFAIYLATDDVSQWLNIQGNLNPENQPYYGIRMSFTSREKVYHGAHIHRNPATKTFYTIRVSVGADGRASVQLMDGNSLLCSEGGLQVGTGPFRVPARYVLWDCMAL